MTTISLSPQPLGIFPLPASYLLLPAVPNVDSAHAQLMQGHIPSEVPEGLQFFTLTLAGDVEAAFEALDGQESLEARYNRFVLRSEPAQYAALRAELTGEWRQLLDVVAYTLGYIEHPPALEEAQEAQDERLAFILMAQASHHLEQNDYPTAIKLLEEATRVARPVSPIFAAQLLATLADTKNQSQQGGMFFAVQHYEQAIKLLEPSSLHLTRAEMWLNLGIIYQEMARGQRSALLKAVQCYQEALRVFTRDNHPELYALAQNNLALGYLSMPLQEASDQLRMGIAVQALREVLKIYTRDTHPEQWASAQLNLANALQYLPSSHPQENLIQAVELYEEVLAVRDKWQDPIGYARLLANQGNALAHLGIFPHARPKLKEALSIFEAYGEQEAAFSLMGVLSQIEKAPGE
jgi:tetratricopeptide (TPR) repeat protein